MYQRLGKAAYRADLTTSLLLDKHLYHPHRSYPTIHVGGTNGKGSVCHYLASVLQEAGYKTGLHTSPHYTDYRERIKVNGEYITEAAVVEFVAENKAFFEEVKPSFFEMSVFMAFWYFQQQKVDVAIIEVGMGGRLDSTNVITPILSIITNISLDHTAFLGDTREKIACEKAGIIKPGVPVLLGEEHPETMPVFEEVAEKNNSSVYTVAGMQQVFSFQRTIKAALRKKIKDEPAFRISNIETVCAAVSLLKDEFGAVKNEHMSNGIKNVHANTRYMGRWQVLQNRPLVICDSGHNHDGVQEVVKQLQKLQAEKCFLVLSFVNDKNLDDIFPLFPKKWHYVFTQSSVERAMPAEKLAEAAHKAGLQGSVAGDWQQAVNQTIAMAGAGDVVFIGGSTFLVADVLGMKKS